MKPPARLPGQSSFHPSFCTRWPDKGKVMGIMAQKSLEELQYLVSSGPPYPAALLKALRSDKRAGAQRLYRRCSRQMDHETAETSRLESMLQYERELDEAGFRMVAGVDEAGRGPLAGPIVASAVILAFPMIGLNDSKKLTPEYRDILYDNLMEGPHGIGIAMVEAHEIDRIGIQQANYRAMAMAVEKLEPEPDYLMVDGFQLPGVRWPVLRLVKGDQRSLSIAAASIVAKVTRDRIMEELDKKFPGYGFAQHKGYATQAHLEAIERLGPCPEHRRSFAPLSRSQETRELFS